MLVLDVLHNILQWTKLSTGLNSIWPCIARQLHPSVWPENRTANRVEYTKYHNSHTKKRFLVTLTHKILFLVTLAHKKSFLVTLAHQKVISGYTGTQKVISGYTGTPKSHFWLHSHKRKVISGYTHTKKKSVLVTLAHQKVIFGYTHQKRPSIAVVQSSSFIAVLLMTKTKVLAFCLCFMEV